MAFAPPPYIDPVARCACGDWLYIEACAGDARFHCRDCGYCHTHARAAFTIGHRPDSHALGAA